MSEISAAEREIAERVIGDVREALGALVDHGKRHVIDLRAVPRMGEEAYRLLKDILGTGEISAVVNTTARAEIWETGCPGVWWLTYYRASGDISTEMIEVALIPQILVATKAQASLSREKLGVETVRDRLG
jgi:hydrogenase-1 operon protein HyaF